MNSATGPTGFQPRIEVFSSSGNRFLCESGVPGLVVSPKITASCAGPREGNILPLAHHPPCPSHHTLARRGCQRRSGQAAGHSVPWHPGEVFSVPGGCSSPSGPSPYHQPSRVRCWAAEQQMRSRSARLSGCKLNGKGCFSS